MAFEDIIKMGYGHNLIIGNSTPKYIIERAEKIQNQQIGIGQYGLFDAPPEAFTPAESASAIAPKPEDFINPIYRALSEVIVHRQWNPVDFGVNGVLKKSMSLLRGQTIYKNHNAETGTEVGAVSDVAWENSSKNGDITVPAGINATMKVDALSNTKLARGILMDPPSVHSTSVTVVFLWEKSHATLSEEEFWKKLGTFDKEGLMIRRIATNINRFNELSFVPHGADPFAQQIGKNGIVNPVHAQRTYSLSDQKKNQKWFFFDFQTDLIKNGEENTIPAELNNVESHQNKTSDMNQYLLMLAATFGVTVTAGMTEEALHAAIEAKRISLAASATPNPITNEEVTRLRAIETGQTALSTRITGYETAETKRLTEGRAKVLGLYNKATTAVAGAKPLDAIVNMINNATEDSLPALELQYAAQVEAAFPQKCQKCGSSAVTRASSTKLGGNAEGEDTTGEGEEKTNEEVMENLSERFTSKAAKSFFDDEDPKK